MISRRDESSSPSGGNVGRDRNLAPQRRPQDREKLDQVGRIGRADDVVPGALFADKFPIKRNGREPVRVEPRRHCLCKLLSIRDRRDEIREVLRPLPPSESQARPLASFLRGGNKLLETVKRGSNWQLETIFRRWRSCIGTNRAAKFRSTENRGCTLMRVPTKVERDVRLVPVELLGSLHVGPGWIILAHDLWRACHCTGTERTRSVRRRVEARRS